jgi:hypothetical protein
MRIESRKLLAIGILGRAYRLGAGLCPAEDQASINRLPFGSGTRSPNSVAVSTHSPIASFTAMRASCCVGPCAMQPGNSGTSARYASSSLLQYKMISYLVVSTGKAILHNNSPYLSHLVRFGMTAVPLQVDPFLHARFSEQMMAASRPPRESQALKQSAQVFKADARVRGAAQQAREGSFRTQGAIVAAPKSGEHR